LINCEKLHQFPEKVVLPVSVEVFLNNDSIHEIPIISVKDTDNNVYSTVEIGNQIWMAENLKTTRYNDGSRIFPATGGIVGSRWFGLETGAYCWFENDSVRYSDLYGAIYNWNAVNTGM